MELDELEREGELASIAELEKADEVREVDKAVETNEVVVLEGVNLRWELVMLLVAISDIGVVIVVPWRTLLELSREMAVDETMTEVMLVDVVMIDSRLVDNEEDALNDRDANEDEDMECPVKALVGRNTKNDDDEGSNSDPDGDPEIPISRPDEAENPGSKLLASELRVSDSPTFGAALLITLSCCCS
ncbi:hypothetical protein MMC26_006565 [Xylographa opegraphella]|nr:hypothetical protein [Xylographa opegraphella]